MNFTLQNEILGKIVAIREQEVLIVTRRAALKSNVICRTEMKRNNDDCNGARNRRKGYIVNAGFRLVLLKILDLIFLVKHDFFN